MAGERGRLARDTFHEIAVAADRVDVVIEDLRPRPVVAPAQPARGDRHADAVAATLAERSGRGLHTRRMAVFRMSRRDAVELPEALDVLEADGELVAYAIAFEPAHAREVQQRIEQHRGVPRREHEAIAVGPGR